MKAKLIKLALHDGYRLDDENGLFIASTLESSKNKLSLKNCEAIERGYDLDELADIYSHEACEDMYEQEGLTGAEWGWETALDFKKGFQKALELMGDKKFSEKDIYEAFSLGERGDRFELGDLLDSRQKTEWDVEIEMRPASLVYKTDEMLPKLDADECLILKLITE